MNRHNYLDKVFSEWIRKRDADENGYVKCCTCPTVKHWKEMQCGHYHSRQHMKIRWHENNAHAQCHECNCHKDGNRKKYYLFMMAKYSESELGELWIGAHRRFDGFMLCEIKKMIKLYRSKINAVVA